MYFFLAPNYKIIVQERSLVFKIKELYNIVLKQFRKSNSHGAVNSEYYLNKMKIKTYNFFQKNKKYLESLDLELKNLFPKARQEKIYKISRSYIKSEGKKLRSLLSLLSCEIICGNYKLAIPLALAYELAHNASLIQDDIIDNSPLRRGEATINFKYGTNTAILVSDIFIFQIFNEIAKYQKYNLSKKQICSILKIVGKCGQETAMGESLDEKFTGKFIVSTKEYFSIIKLKTGKLFASPMACGAVVGSGTTKEINIMYKVGENIGLAFQVYDDLLDIIGKEGTLGKPVFNDIKNGKQNIVIIHAFQNASPNERKFIQEIFGKKNSTGETYEHKIVKFREILEKTKSVSYAKETSQRITEKVKKYLRSIKNNNNSPKEKILEAIQFIIERNI